MPLSPILAATPGRKDGKVPDAEIKKGWPTDSRAVSLFRLFIGTKINSFARFPQRTF